MTATLMDGKALAERIRADVAREVAELGHVGLATVLVGDDPASHVYISGKHKAATEAGIEARDVRLPADTSEADVLALVAELNADDEIDGILVQLPLPGAHRRDEGDVRRRAAQGRRRLPSRERRQPLPRDAAPRARDAGRLHGAPRRVRHRPHGEGGGRHRPQRDRGEARGHAPPAGERDRHGLPLADGRPRGGGAARRHRGRRGGRARHRHARTWSSPAPPCSTSG